MICSEDIKRKALELGFDDCGISKVRKLDDQAGYLRDWLNGGMDGEMRYMSNNFDMRLDPSLLFSGAKSIISVVLNYKSSREPNYQDSPYISDYALGKDYHFVIKNRLSTLLEYIQEKDSSVKGVCFTDSAPILERRWAVEAGLGWIGKNGNLISPQFGSKLFIGELIITEAIEYDKPYSGSRCGNCTKCIDSCPTKAIQSDKVVDGSKCLSYLTIEKRTDLDEGTDLFNSIFGCDICLNSCPWNSKTEATQIAEFKSDPRLIKFDPEFLLTIGSNQFKREFSSSPLLRAGLKTIRRNIDLITES